MTTQDPLEEAERHLATIGSQGASPDNMLRAARAAALATLDIGVSLRRLVELEEAAAERAALDGFTADELIEQLGKDIAEGSMGEDFASLTDAEVEALQLARAAELARIESLEPAALAEARAEAVEVAQLVADAVEQADAESAERKVKRAARRAGKKTALQQLKASDAEPASGEATEADWIDELLDDEGE